MKIAGFGVEEWLNKWEKSAHYDISQSTISSMTLSELISLDPIAGEKLIIDIQNSKLNYGWIEGSPDFKRAASKLYDHMPESNILQTNGATGANHLALYSLIEPGDHVIAEYPSYQQLYDIPKSLGATVEYWHIHESLNWGLDIDELKKLIRPDTKRICLNNANNPTGTLLSPQILKEISEVARSVGAYVLVDEVYLPLNDPTATVSIVDVYERGIATNSLSKTYSVPGVRLGWVACSEDLANVFRKYRDYTMICTGVISDLIGTFVLEHRELILKRNRALVERNLAILKEWVGNEDLVEMIFPQAVSTSLVKLKIDPTQTEKFCVDLLQEKGVLLVPGNRFDLPGYARLGYCTDEQTLRNGLQKLSEFLHEQ